MTDYINFDGITRNALGWESYFKEAKSDPNVEKDRISRAFGIVKGRSYGIIKSGIEHAIDMAPIGDENEFARETIKGPLLDAFLSDEMLRVTEDGYVYLNAEGIAGDDADLWDGISSARAVLKRSDKELSPVQKANFWRHVVYPSYSGASGTGDTGSSEDEEDLWTLTMGTRFSFWKGLAPYWIFLENGNVNFGRGEGIPFPRNRATNFKMRIERELNRIMDLALLEVDSLESNVIDETMNNFIQDPENRQPYDILEEFYSDSRKYYVYITPTRKIGVALETSYKRMYGR